VVQVKLAVLADVHGNYAALERVVAHIDQWGPDRVIVAGDLVNRGPRSLDCLRLIEEKQLSKGWQVLKGNHEDYVIAQDKPDSPRHGPLYEIYLPTYWTYCELGCDVSALECMPDVITFEVPDGEVRTTHASMLGNQSGIFPFSVEDELREKMGSPPPRLFIVAHTHYPLIRQVDDTLIVNIGAVGLPFDKDWRAGYGQFTWNKDHWEAAIVRLEYDRQRTIADFKTTGFLQEGGPLTWLMLAELLFARSQLFSWVRDYHDAILAGETTMEASSREQLTRKGMWETVKEHL
jgi:predicted phosphodiesterase